MIINGLRNLAFFSSADNFRRVQMQRMRRRRIMRMRLRRRRRKRRILWLPDMVLWCFMIPHYVCDVNHIFERRNVFLDGVVANNSSLLQPQPTVGCRQNREIPVATRRCDPTDREVGLWLGLHLLAPWFINHTYIIHIELVDWMKINQQHITRGHHVVIEPAVVSIHGNFTQSDTSGTI